MGFSMKYTNHFWIPPFAEIPMRESQCHFYHFGNGKHGSHKNGDDLGMVCEIGFTTLWVGDLAIRVMDKTATLTSSNICVYIYIRWKMVGFPASHPWQKRGVDLSWMLMMASRNDGCWFHGCMMITWWWPHGNSMVTSWWYDGLQQASALG